MIEQRDNDDTCGYTFTPIELLSFLKGRFNYAGCSASVTREYAKDIENTLKSIKVSSNTLCEVSMGDVENSINFFEGTFSKSISLNKEQKQEYYKHLENIKTMFNNFPFENEKLKN